MAIEHIREPWGGRMTARERFNRQLHFQSVDRCFNMEFGYWQENYRQWKMFTENGITNEGEANRFFSFDRYGIVGGVTDLHPGFPVTRVGETATTWIEQNRDGLTGEVLKSGTSSIPHYTKSSVTTPEDWARVKEQHFRLDDPARRPDLDAIRRAAPDDRDWPVGIDCGSMIGRIRDMLTFEGLCYAQYDYPEMVEDMVETRCRLVEQFLDAALEVATFDFASGWEDICFNKGPIVSVDFYREIITPRYARIHKKLRDHGIDIWYTDCDGDVRPILSCLMDGGINCLFPYEVNSCEHPAALMAKYPGSLHIMGGFDKMQLIAGKDAIDAYLRSIEKLVEGGGYIPFCDHRCPPDVTEENYLYYLDRKREMFGGGY